MSLFSGILIIIGLAAFETISSIDNAIINAEVLSTMKPKYQRRFLVRGILIAVFLVRGLLPWLIMYFTAPQLGFIGSLTATFSNNPSTHAIIAQAAPVLMMGGGIFLVFLFFHRLFLEDKHFGLRHEKFFQAQGGRFYAVVSIILTALVRYAMKSNPMMAFGAVVGSSAFFITHGFKNYAEQQEEKMAHGKTGISDIAKILYLEVIDATFSIDGVLGAFAFTLSVPLILLGNGLGAFLVRRLTVSNIERIKKYKYLKNGAMYSIFFLGIIMVMRSFSLEIPERVSPIITFGVIGYFFRKSKIELKTLKEIIE
ncbi:MAG: DUF475 domain-containing protein [Candidatus Absconditabacteria bacterium]